MGRVKFEVSLNNDELKKYGIKIERDCPFCNNDYIKVERKIRHIDNEFIIGAYCVCGVCGTQGPIVIEETTKKDDALEKKVIVEAVTQWNEGVKYG